MRKTTVLWSLLLLFIALSRVWCRSNFLCLTWHFISHIAENTSARWGIWKLSDNWWGIELRRGNFREHIFWHWVRGRIGLQWVRPILRGRILRQLLWDLYRRDVLSQVLAGKHRNADYANQEPVCCVHREMLDIVHRVISHADGLLRESKIIFARRHDDHGIVAEEITTKCPA